MQITVDLTTCRDCRHRDHSGAFTRPEAQIICGHYDAARLRRSKTSLKNFNPKYYSEMKRDKWKHWKHHWWHRVLDDQKTLAIPDWCPLKNGSSY